jgi:hypothetical protein
MNTEKKYRVPRKIKKQLKWNKHSYVWAVKGDWKKGYKFNFILNMGYNQIIYNVLNKAGRKP